MEGTKRSFIIAGGGTGGHIFPAIAIADALRRAYPSCSILFIGAEGRMEMERVPRAGYPIKGIAISGFDRKRLLRNLKVLYQLFRGVREAKRNVREAAPDCVIGVGGYVSAPALLAAQQLHVPTVIQEQNSFAGIANRRLARRVDAICVAYEGMERFFPKKKLVLTGNPIREALEKKPLPSKKEALEQLALPLNEHSPMLLVVGGSLGARTINQTIEQALPQLAQEGIGLLWQTGKHYINRAEEALATLPEEAQKRMRAVAFIDNMPAAYRACDLMVARAGASTISEIQCLGVASILVPSPNVAEDHQTHNAMALVRKEAALLVSDANAPKELARLVIETIQDKEKLTHLGENVHAMHLGNAADQIVQVIKAVAKL